MSEAQHVQTSYRLMALLRVCEHAARNIDNVGEASLAAVSGSLADSIELAADMAGQIHDVLDATAGPLPAMGRAYRSAHDAFNGEVEDGSAEHKRLEVAFDAARDSIFLYHPVNLSEVSEKASILLDIWNDAEGLTDDRVKEMLTSFGGRALTGLSCVLHHPLAA